MQNCVCTTGWFVHALLGVSSFKDKEKRTLLPLSVSAFAENLLILKHTLLHQSQRLVLEVSWFQVFTVNEAPPHFCVSS